MRFPFASAVVAAAGMVAGCHQDNQDIKRELAGIRQDIQGLRAQITRPAAPARPQPPAPDPAKVYAVGVDGAPAIGPEAAPLTVVIAYEYACPWCNKQRQAFAAVREAYGDDVRFVFRPYVVHPEVATDAALAVCAAAHQGHFAEVNDAMWSNVFDKRAFDRASVENAAASVAGIDLAKLKSEMAGGCKAWLAREQIELSALGVNATPQVWVNGRPVPGGYKPLDGLKPLLDEELARARQRIAAGSPAATYYADWVLKNGLAKLASR